MGLLKIKKISLGLLIIVLVFSSGYLLALNRVNVVIDNSMFVLDESAIPVKYKIISDNTLNCNLATFSTIYHNMINDGYYAENISCDKDQIDVLLIKEDNQIRILYKRDGLLASIANPYEKSYIPMTYISEVEIVQTE